MVPEPESNIRHKGRLITRLMAHLACLIPTKIPTGCNLYAFPIPQDGPGSVVEAADSAVMFYPVPRLVGTGLF